MLYFCVLWFAVHFQPDISGLITTRSHRISVAFVFNFDKKSKPFDKCVLLNGVILIYIHQVVVEIVLS